CRCPEGGRTGGATRGRNGRRDRGRPRHDWNQRDRPAFLDVERRRARARRRPAVVRARLLRTRQCLLHGLGRDRPRPRAVHHVDRRQRQASFGSTGMTCSASEMMTVAAARALTNDDIRFVAIALPSAACNLARLKHAPRLTLVYESGTLETKPTVLPLSIGDGELCETALTTVSVPEMFQYWLQGGRITVGF